MSAAYTPQALESVVAYLRTQSRDGKTFSGFSWHDIGTALELQGPGFPVAHYSVFKALEEANHIRQIESAPGTYGHCVYAFVTSAAPVVTDYDRRMMELRMAAPQRGRSGRLIPTQSEAGHLPLFVAANEPSLF